MKFLPTFATLALAASFGGLSAQNLKPREDPAYLKKAAVQVDQHIASFYRNKKLPVPEVTDDATFLRRAFLVSIGRIPTAEEALAAGRITTEEKDRWHKELNQLAANGDFYYGLVYHAIVGTRMSASPPP